MKFRKNKIRGTKLEKDKETRVIMKKQGKVVDNKLCTMCRCSFKKRD